MNYKRFWMACAAVFIFVFAYDWIFHGVLLKDAYMATAQLWRPVDQMETMRGWMTFGQLFLAVMFCYIFTKGYQNRGIGEGVRYGLYIGLLMLAPLFIAYATEPFPFALIVWWGVGTLVETVFAGTIAAKVYHA